MWRAGTRRRGGVGVVAGRTGPVSDVVGIVEEATEGVAPDVAALVTWAFLIDVALHEFGEGNLARGRVVDHQASGALSIDLIDRVLCFFERSGNEGGALSTGAHAHEPGVVYLDEIPYGSSSALADGRIMAPNIDAFDLKRIEVLRGPQGTLYGANTLGRLVRFVTHPPNPSRFDAELQWGADDIAHAGVGWSTRAMVKIPLARAAALRIDGYRWKHAGFIADPTRQLSHVNGAGEKGGRVSLLWGGTRTT